MHSQLDGGKYACMALCEKCDVSLAIAKICLGWHEKVFNVLLAFSFVIYGLSFYVIFVFLFTRMQRRKTEQRLYHTKRKNRQRRIGDPFSLGGNLTRKVSRTSVIVAFSLRITATLTSMKR